MDGERCFYRWLWPLTWEGRSVGLVRLRGTIVVHISSQSSEKGKERERLGPAFCFQSCMRTRRRSVLDFKPEHLYITVIVATESR